MTIKSAEKLYTESEKKRAMARSDRAASEDRVQEGERINGKYR